jgi:hypothetical protein
MKRIGTVKRAKKFLKNEMDILHPNKKRYTMIRWNKKRKIFLVDTMHGQRISIFAIYTN